MKYSYNPNRIGQRLKEARLDKKWSLKELSSKLKLSDATLSRYENGETAKIKTPIIYSLAEVLEVEEDWILGLNEEKRKNDRIYSHPNNIPMIGSIQIGIPLLSKENIKGYFSLDNSVSCDFCLRVEDDSMIGEGIQNGDIVFIKQQSTVRNGEIGAIVIDEKITLRRIYKKKNDLILQSANNIYPPILTTHENINIAGTLIATLNLRGRT